MNKILITNINDDGVFGSENNRCYPYFANNTINIGKTEVPASQVFENYPFFVLEIDKSNRRWIIGASTELHDWIVSQDVDYTVESDLTHDKNCWRVFLLIEDDNTACALKMLIEP